jgi:exodeoxyribonuclease VII small subunit
MNADPSQPQSFEQALAELDRIVGELEDGRIGLEEALTRYERGIGLIKHCRQLLSQAEQRICLLAGIDESGEPILTPFDAADSPKPGDEATVVESRRRKRSGASREDALFGS